MSSRMRARSRAYRCSTVSPAADRESATRPRSSQPVSQQRGPVTQPVDDAAARRLRRVRGRPGATGSARATDTLATTAPELRARALGLGPLAAHKLKTAGVLILMTGLAVTGALLLAHGHPAAAPRRSLLAATTQFAASDARSVATQKRAMSFTVERLAAERQAAEPRGSSRAAARRKARCTGRGGPAGPHQSSTARERAQTIYASAATPATSTATSAEPVASTAADPTGSGSAAASETSSAQGTTPTSEPTITSTSPSSFVEQQLDEPEHVGQQTTSIWQCRAP